MSPWTAGAATGDARLDDMMHRALARVESDDRVLLANSRYREGYADFQRVLDAQTSVFSQTTNQLVNQGNHISAVVALYKALGGGWVAPAEAADHDSEDQVVGESTVNIETRTISAD